MSRYRKHPGAHCLMRASTQNGVALILVLWMLALLTVIANSMVASMRSEVQVAANLVSSARAEAAADAGVFKAILALSIPGADPQQWQGNDLAHDWAFGDARMSITIVDEGGKIDLNAAPETLLASMFRSVGMDTDSADGLADAISDWRDADDLRHPHGAEREEYVAAGMESGPRNGKFESIEELRQVLGMSNDVFQRVAPLITVNSGQPGVDSSVAPRGVLMALPGVTPDQVDAYVAQRQTALAQGLPVSGAPFAQGSPGRRLGDTFTIQVHAVLGENTAHFFREAVVKINRNPKEPVVFLAWRSPPVGVDPISSNKTDN